MHRIGDGADDHAVHAEIPYAKQGRFAHQHQGSGPPSASAKPLASIRNQAEARRVLNKHYPFKCCAVCGLQLATCLTVAHLDHDSGNNAADNLARLCQTHHWMYDAGLYPIEAIRLLQAHWQTVRGVPSHKARMKDAGAKASVTRKRKAAARKAVATRKSREEGG